MEWKIIMYVSGNRAIVEEFIDSLQPSTYGKALRLLNLLRAKGANLGMPYSRALGKGMFELRITGRQEIRLFYIFGTQRQVFIVHGFEKKTQRMPQYELLVARRRQKELTRI